ncbi:MAG: glycoside hydrolase family 16 protein [Kiritimatiellae bacterium]|jgi:beta-glucanase (GH16 family)|nr:glycoside hydrolase family 16 protein [Kiritimatiellia bacterium]
MRTSLLNRILTTVSLILLTVSVPVHSHAQERLSLLSPGGETVPLTLKANIPEMTHERVEGGLQVQVAPTEKSPSLYLAPETGSWDLSKYGHVEAQITNSSDRPLIFNLRVDNEGDWRQQPWNIERKRILPGKSEAIRVIFGYQFGFNKGYALDSSAVSKLVVFLDKTDQPLEFRIDSIVASGLTGDTPPVDPQSIRHRPADGFLLGGGGASLDVSKQVRATGGVQASLVSDGNESRLLVASEGQGPASQITLHPPSGSWDLSQATDLMLSITNTGTTAILPTLTLSNRDKNEKTREVSTDQPIGPGATVVLTVPFGAETVWEGPEGDDFTRREDRLGTGGTRFRSERVDRIVLAWEHSAPASLRVNGLKAIAQRKAPPEWVGKRPPVDGEWALTLNENFDGDAIDETVWDVSGPNWWGQKQLTHWSRRNVLLENGNAIIRMVKRPGHHNDDPEGRVTDYSGGILRTFDRWTQRYGYFEARVKLPTETAMWPAFWLMPDRGPNAGDVYQRERTNDGGMEFDIMENLTRWGPYRYTTALHWDGYGEGHKATGAAVYFYPDEDGYVTSGVLWLPGFMAYYCQGIEVARWENDRVSDVPSSILFTMPIGGWDNENRPVDSELPAEFHIDYVRVWQRADLLDQK